MQNNFQVHIQATTSSSHPLFEQLVEFYLYDFSEFMGSDLDEQGRFGPGDLLDGCWVDPRRHTYLIRVNGQIAGFAIVDRLDIPFPGEPQWEMAEFFILRNYRRRGIARIGVLWLFAHHPGRWVVKEFTQNSGAIRFWRRVISQTTGDSYQEISLPHGIAQVFTV